MVFKILVYFKNKKFIDYLLFVVLIFSIYLTFSLTNIYFNALSGADNTKYFQNILYIFGETNTPYDNQGLLYYFIVSFFIKLRAPSFNYSKNLIEISKLDQIFLSETILMTNLFLFILGLAGLYFFMKEINLSNTRSLFILIFLCYFPSIYYVRLNMKPEILAFALLPWVFYFFEKYLINRQVFELVKIALIISILVTSKGSIFGMLSIILFLKYLLHFRNFNLKNFTIGLTCFFIFIFSISIENNMLGIGNLLDRQPESNYNNKASPKIISNIDIERLLKDPKKNYHRNSLISITLIDLTSDYFELNWNEDSTIFSKNQKPLIVNRGEGSKIAKKLFAIDFENKNIIYNGPGQNYTHYHLRYIGLIFALYFTYKTFKIFLIEDKKNKLYLIMPILGIIVLLVNTIYGIPQNNYDPQTGDTFKVFYYSFLIPYPIIFVFKNIKLNKLKHILFVIIFIVFSFINLGFPKSNNENLDLEIKASVENTIMCEVNKTIINNTFITKNKISCSEKSIQGVLNTKFSRIPFISVILFIISIFTMLHEFLTINSRSIFSYFLKTKR